MPFKILVSERKVIKLRVSASKALATAICSGADIYRGDDGSRRIRINGVESLLWFCARPADWPGRSGIVVCVGRWICAELESLRTAATLAGADVVTGEEFLARFKREKETTCP